MPSDEEIRRDVEKELRWEPDLAADNIAVGVKDGVVTLAGFVPSYVDKLDAEKVTKRVAGVVGIANDLEVRLPSIHERPDPEIARDAAAAIKAQLPARADKIKVVVENGEITLEGSVPWHYQKDVAEMAVRRICGVKNVRNLIELQPVVDPTELQRKIKEAFRRNAELDAENISIEADRSVVTLKGTVRSWAERDEAERIAWSAPGVTKVSDEIVVRP
jgi:osmotically-inducible protein OsmY